MLTTLVTILLLLVAAAAVAVAWRGAQRERQRSEARVAALAAVLDPEPLEARPLLGTHAGRTTGAHPLLAIAVGFVVVVSAIVAAALVAEVRAPQARAAAGAPELHQEASLALLALRYEREMDGLLVKGLVENQGPRPAREITAVVLAFNREGRLVARSTGPLRMPGRGSGVRADFAVRLGRPAEVVRYQVSFQGAEGIIRHVDLRQRRGDRPPALLTVPASRIVSSQSETVSP